MFRNIKGQANALQILKLAMENQRIAQAYLFHGSEGVGKFTTALYFGMALNCVAKSEFRPCGVCPSCRKFLALDHPDLLYVFPTPNLQLSIEGEIKSSEGRREYDAYISNKIETPWEEYQFSSNIMIRIESIRWLIKRLDITKYEATQRICIIEDADQMNIETSNAFLKTLEEPPQDTVIILLTDNLSRLLPTIVSRCQPVHFQPVTPSVIENVLVEKFSVSLEQARTASHIADGSVKRAIHLVRGETTALRDRAFEIFQMAAEDKELAYYRSLQAPAAKLNVEALTDLIRYLSLFAGDLNLAESAPSQLVNIDKKDYIQAARANLVDGDAAELTDRVLEFMGGMEDFIRKLRGNVNPQLVMTNLYFRLRRVFRG